MRIFILSLMAAAGLQMHGQLDATGQAYKDCQHDSTFAIANSIEAIYTIDFDIMYRDETTPPHMHTILDGPIGTVAGPVMENGRKAYYKSISADSTLSFHTAHIIVTHSMHPDGEAKRLIEEAYAQLEANMPWTKVVDAYSEDGTVERDGDLDWATESMFVPSFSAACKRLKKGEKTIVETEYGWHIIWMKSAPKKARKKVTCLRMATK